MAILPWGVETQGEVSQVLTQQLRVTVPWAIAGVLLSHTLADYALSRASKHADRLDSTTEA